MTKLENLMNQLNAFIKTMQDQLDADETDKAAETKNKVDALIAKIEMQKQIDSLEKDNIQNDPSGQAEPNNSSEKTNATFIRAAIKKMTGKPVTEAENALLLPTTSSPDGANGEGYILPQDIRTQINKRIMDFKSFREAVGKITTTCLTGSFVYEDLSNIAGLVDFTDGTEGAVSEDPKFTKIAFSLKEKGALISLSNTLITMTDNDLVSYIVDYFAKKAVITENTMAITALKSNKTVKTLADYAALKASINTDLDPASLYGTVIVTNQDGFNLLDSQLDGNGRPILQPDPTIPTVKRFMGYEVKVYSNSQLPSTAATASEDGYAPIFYGNLTEGVKFVDGPGISFATSTEAGFTKNVTIARIIEFVDVVQCDKSDKCYIYGQLKVADKTA